MAWITSLGKMQKWWFLSKFKNPTSTLTLTQKHRNYTDAGYRIPTGNSQETTVSWPDTPSCCTMQHGDCTLRIAGKKQQQAGKGWRDETDRAHDYCVYLREGGGAGGHQNLTHAVVEALHWLIIHTQETLSCPLFSNLNHKLKVNYLWKCQRNKKQLWPPLSPSLPVRPSWLTMKRCAMSLTPHPWGWRWAYSYHPAPLQTVPRSVGSRPHPCGWTPHSWFGT